MELCPLVGFLIFPFSKIFVTEPKKATKLKVCINMDNDWMYTLYTGIGAKSP